MGSPYLSPYEDPDAHARISALIRRHSTNDRDVRTELLGALDLAGARDILDLGCGFGFWAEELAARVAPEAVFTGVDACGANRAAYLRCIEARGRRACFRREHLVSTLPFGDGAFDLVIAAYSLYFFPGVIPEAARVLRPGGSFLVVTHSERSFRGLLEAVGLADEDCLLLRRLRAFSSEGGGALLAGTFGHVGHVNYLNTLTFEAKDLGDLLAYLAFKLPQAKPGARYGVELPDAFVQAASAALHGSGRITVEKDDTLFVCGGARGR